MRGAILNPIRFYPSDLMPDYISVFPNFDNITYGNAYFFGVNASRYCIRVHVGDLYLQFLNPDNAAFELDVYKLSESNTFEVVDTVTSVDISPVGWVGYEIHKVTLSLADGVYYLSNNDYKSDIFRVTSNTRTIKDLVKIKYSNSINDFGCIFDTNYFEAYFMGNFKSGEPKNDIEAYNSDRGNPVKLRATPIRTATINILALHQTYKDLVEHIFSCDTIEVNGVLYENTESPQWSDIDGSDMGNITIKLVKKINDYYHG